MDKQAQYVLKQLSWRELFYFFLPLGFSASLVTVSHVIVNSTLARAPDPAFVIASYAIALSLFTVFERNAIMLRPTAAKLVQDQKSFKAVTRVTFYVLLVVMLITLSIAYTYLGKWIFTYFFGVEKELLPATLTAYKVLVFVTVFSIIRCLFQGIIIGHLRTKWMTIGMVVRLIAMAAVAWCLFTQGLVQHGYIGAVIFLIGMAVEAVVSTIEGLYIIKKLPKRLEGHKIEKGSHVFKFYYPLLFASFMGVLIQPSINATLGWSEKGALAVAAYAVAWSVTQLFLSFTSYVHQIVLNFYHINKQLVLRFTACVSLVPVLCLSLISFTPLGTLFLEHVIGLTDQLLVEGLLALKFFLIYALVFPWLDFCHGLVMYSGETKKIAFTQACNIMVTWLMLAIMFFNFPGLGGAIGSIAQGIGFLFELILLALIFNTHLLKKIYKETDEPSTTDNTRSV